MWCKLWRGELRSAQSGHVGLVKPVKVIDQAESAYPVAEAANRSAAMQSIAKAVLIAILAGATWFASPGLVQARGPQSTEAAVPAVNADQLPAQAKNMLMLIYQGGPFKFDKDGVVFGNRERILPANPRGYYREYTVKTPREQSRGARRIVCGGAKPAAPEACYYTDDHYASFRRIVQ